MLVRMKNSTCFSFVEHLLRLILLAIVLFFTLHSCFFPLQTLSTHQSCLGGYRARLGFRPLRAYATFPKVDAPQNGAKWRASQWLENSAQADVDIPLEEAWALWEDRSRIPEWMAWITSVAVMEDDPRLSKWTLSTYQFNRQVGNLSIDRGT